MIKLFSLLFPILLLLSTIDASAQTGNWEFIHDGSDCSSHGTAGSCMQGRHEASYVQVGDKFYLLGGRENNSNVNIYDPIKDIWTIGSDAPMAIHHFQAVEYNGLILIAGAMTGNYPSETPIPNIIIYDPKVDKWYTGPAIDRPRGSAGVVIHDDKLYLVSGILDGHRSGWVPWMDVYDLKANTWNSLGDAPHSRDHFHAAIVGTKIVVGGGRRSGEDGTFNATEGAVDIYNISTNRWTTNSRDLPTHRAANSVGVIGEEVIYIGGERNSGDANDQTEALNISTGRWRTLAPLNEGRHGTQAIVNNDNIWVASGSPNRGGGTTKTQERFYLNSRATPTVYSINQSDIEASSSFTVNSTTKTLVINNTGGNQAILVQEINISGDRSFSYTIDKQLPFLVKSGESFDVNVKHTSGDNDSGVLEIKHTGKNKTETVNINSQSPINNNIAPDGTPSQSSTGWGGNPFRAIDRNTSGNYGHKSVTHTKVESKPHWQVEWDDNYIIDEIKVFNRTDYCCTQRLSDFKVMILDASNNVKYTKSYTTAPSPSLTINTGGVIGKTVRVQLNDTNPLSLAEVEVYGRLSDGDSTGGSDCSTFKSDNFNSGYGIWNDGGGDAYRGDFSDITSFTSDVVRIRDNTSGSNIYTDALNLSSYDEANIEFQYYPVSMEAGEDFFLEVSTNGGSSFTIIEEWNSGVEFENGRLYSESVSIPSDKLASNTVFRFRCDATANADQVYLDNIIIETCSVNFQNDEVLNSRERVTISEEKSELSIYPNPAQDLLNVRLDGSSTINELEVLSTFGKRVSIHRNIDDVNYVLDLAKLDSNQAYLVRIITSTGEIIINKFLKL